MGLTVSTFNFHPLSKAKVRNSDGVVFYLVNWDGKGYWETEESMLLVDDPVKRERFKEMLRRVKLKFGIVV